MLLKHSTKSLWNRKHSLPMLLTFFLEGAKRNFHFSKTLQSEVINKISSRPMRTQLKAWNEAASMIIVAPMNNSEPYSLGYLLVERSRTGRVMPGNWVYPGGNADPGDSDVKWIPLFKSIYNVDILNERFFSDTAHIPEIYTENENQIPKSVSLRIAAIREVFEEAGILLCRPKKLDPSKHLFQGLLHYEFPELEDKNLLQAWQKRVRKDSQDFMELCKELECVPDIWAANDWSNWLSPAIFKPKSRFDTIFYMIILPRMPRVVIDGNEAVSAKWISPNRIIVDHSKGEIRLMPPQIYEFSRLRQLKTIKDLQQRITLRKELGIERFCPVIRNAVDGTLFLLPGDDLYPDPPNYLEINPESLEKIPKTISQLRDACKNLHRGIANSDGVITNYEINVTRYGHFY